MRAATCSTRSGSGRLAKARKPSAGIEFALGLEGDRAGEDAAVEFGHHDMHGEVGGGQAALALLPGFAARGGDDDLEDRHAGAVEQGFGAGFGAGGEGGRGDDERRVSVRRGRVSTKASGGGVLQARDEDRDGAHALGAQRLRQRVDRRDIGGEQHRAVEEDGDDGSGCTVGGQRGMVGLMPFADRIIKPAFGTSTGFGSTAPHALPAPPAAAPARVIFSGPPSRK